MRLNLDKMIKEYDAEETTDKIRNLKHSKLIGDDVHKMILFRKKYSRLIKTNFEQYKQMARKQCKFLYDNYTNIFNRLLKDELNLDFILLYEEGGQIIYANTDFDITERMVRMLNESRENPASETAPKEAVSDSSAND